MSELYKISTSSLKRWLKFHKEGQSLDSIGEGKGRKPKVDDAGEPFIAERIADNIREGKGRKCIITVRT